jgi:hypothetical protein
MKDVVFTYVKNGPLVEPAQEVDLPRQMKGLLNWYKSYIKLKNAKDYIYAEVRYREHACGLKILTLAGFSVTPRVCIIPTYYPTHASS